MSKIIVGVLSHSLAAKLAKAIEALPASDEATNLSVMCGELTTEIMPHNGNMPFGHAIEAVLAGHKIARAGWNGKGMYLTIIEPGNAMLHGYDMQPCIGMKTADNKMCPGWLASQTDMLACDWQIVE